MGLKIGPFEITLKEFLLALSISLMGFLFSTKTFLLWLNTLNPFMGFLVYYGVLFTVLFILSRFDLVIAGLKIHSPLQCIGSVFVLFSFLLVVSWKNPFVQFVTTGSFEGASAIFYQTEDGVAWWFWTTVLGISNVTLAHILTFIITPFVLTLLGVMLVSEAIKL